MKKIVALLLLILSITSFTSCDFISSMGDMKYDLEKINAGVVDGNNSFAFRLFQELNTEDLSENIFISPFSISTALTMTYNGAETETKKAMEDTLGYSGTDRGLVNESYRNLSTYLAKLDKSVELNIGNSIWIKEGQNIKKEFIKNNEGNFKAKVEELDFTDPSAADTINSWIADETKNKIKDMLEPPISSDVIMYLINAIYFKGDWSKPFDPKLTYSTTFYAADGTEQTVDMMRHNLNDSVEYSERNGVKAVRLPYGKGKTSMYLMLPEEGSDVNQLLETMNVEEWKALRNSIMDTKDVVLRIPKFKLEYGIKNLNDSLKALGMEEAFSDQADFSGIRDGIMISRVLHKAVIEVNEEGSEAAAATVVEMTESAAAEPITFIADRPFVFIIAEDITNTILFMGKVLSVENLQ